MTTNNNCVVCGQTLTQRHRKYCSTHSALASLLWKRRARQANVGAPYHLDWWLMATGDIEAARQAYNEYMSNYMRRRRVRTRSRRPGKVIDGTLLALVA